MLYVRAECNAFDLGRNIVERDAALIMQPIHHVQEHCLGNRMHGRGGGIIAALASLAVALVH
jgi:hypothetical protein